MLEGVREEVISVVRRRRRWPVERKLALVEEAMRSGASVAGVADRHGISRSLLFQWRRQVREGTMPGLAGVIPEAASKLVAVRIADGPGAGRPASSLPGLASPARSGAMIEVVLRNGRVLRVCGMIAPETLGRLAGALEG